MSKPRRLPLLILLACCALPAWAQEPPNDADRVFMGEIFFSPEEEALYQQRYTLSINRGAPKDLYQPLEPIDGATPWEPLPAAAPEDRTISDEAIREATAYAGENNSSAFIVWRNGRIESETYFDDHGKSSLVNSFSLAKPITALAIGRAIMLGKIRSLDQPVADFVEEWRDDPRRSKILVRHLLDMRAGFLRQGTSPGPGEIMARSFLHPRSEEIIIREYPVVYEPGVRYEYNNATSQMVAVVIERATGRRYAEFIGTEILQKIGAPGGKVWVNREGGMANSGCCILLPAETYLRLGILTMSDGLWDGERLLPESYVEALTTPTAQNPYAALGALYVAGRYTERRGWGNPDLGLAQVLHGEPYLAADLYLFDGNMNQVVYMIPSQNLVILRTGRRPPHSEDAEWDNAVLPNVIMRGIVSDRRSSSPQPR